MAYKRSKEEWYPFLKAMPKEGPCIRGLDFLTSGQTTWDLLKPYVQLSDVKSVLDIGCGHGRMAMPLLGTETRYNGLDIIPGVIQWAKSAFVPWPSIEFKTIAIRNAMYKPKGTVESTFSLDAYGRKFDVILLLSVFTHIQDIAFAKHYLEQVKKVMSNNGKIVVSWFTSPPNEVTSSAARTVFGKRDILSLIASLQLKVVFSLGGSTLQHHDQLVTILENA